jgi:hypothetical protein
MILVALTNGPVQGESLMGMAERGVALTSVRFKLMYSLLDEDQKEKARN